jgi:Pyrimidine dimer DNA glycosylase
VIDRRMPNRMPAQNGAQNARLWPVGNYFAEAEAALMRLWTLHPRYLDSQGLVAAWREALLAQKVLAGETRGYKLRKHAPALYRRFRSVACRIRIRFFELIGVMSADGRRRGSESHCHLFQEFASAINMDNFCKAS